MQNALEREAEAAARALSKSLGLPGIGTRQPGVVVLNMTPAVARALAAVVDALRARRPHPTPKATDAQQWLTPARREAIQHLAETATPIPIVPRRAEGYAHISDAGLPQINAERAADLITAGE